MPLHKAVCRDSYYCFDALHLNNDGYLLLAAQMRPHLQVTSGPAARFRPHVTVALESQQAPRLFCFVSQRVWADTWTDYAKRTFRKVGAPPSDIEPRPWAGVGNP